MRNTRTSFQQQQQKGKECHNQDSRQAVQGASEAWGFIYKLFVFGAIPELDLPIPLCQLLETELGPPLPTC